jgi:hypothetical protein
MDLRICEGMLDQTAQLLNRTATCLDTVAADYGCAAAVFDSRVKEVSDDAQPSSALAMVRYPPATSELLRRHPLPMIKKTHADSISSFRLSIGCIVVLHSDNRRVHNPCGGRTDEDRARYGVVRMAWRRRVRNRSGHLVDALLRLASSHYDRAHVGTLVCHLFDTRDDFHFWPDLACSKWEKRLWAKGEGREPMSNAS